MNTLTTYKSAVPSNHSDLLTGLLGATIAKMTRYSWEPPAKVSTIYHLKESDVFRFTAGPLHLTLDNGVVLGAASDEGLVSVIVWMEAGLGGVAMPGRNTQTDNELYAIDACDQTYGDRGSCALIGRRIESTEIYQCEPSPIISNRPREVALRIRCSNGGELLLAHGLLRDMGASDNFAVLADPSLMPVLLQNVRRLS